MTGDVDGTSARRLDPGGADEDGAERPGRRPPPVRGVEGNTSPSLSVVRSSPAGPGDRPEPLGLLLVHKGPQHVGEPKRPQVTELPRPVQWFGYETDDLDLIGFRPRDAVEMAASAFPRLGVEDDPLGDGTGRRVDPLTGEIIPPELQWRLGISGGLMRIRVVHGRTPVDDSDDLLDTGDWEPSGLDQNRNEDRQRDVVTEFSRRSRNRLRTVAASLDWHAAWQPGLHMLMVTLTYPGDWRTAAPTPDVVNRHRKAFLKRFHRATGHPLAHIWKREFQERGAPHLHLYGWWPRRIGDLYLIAWVSHTWYDVVGTGLREHLNAGTGVDYRQSFDMSNPLRVAFYFSGYASSKGSKEYQNEAPEGWANDNGSVGRYWGRVGLDTILAEIPVTRADAVTIERLLRGVLRSVARTPDRRPRTRRTRYSRTGHGPNGLRKRWIHRRYSLPTLKGTDSGFSYLTADGARLAFDVARTLALADPPPWPKGQPRPLP